VRRGCPGVTTQKTPRGLQAEDWRNGMEKWHRRGTRRVERA
jgi:hypothetical protein